MKRLFDEGTPTPLRRHLPKQSLDTLVEKVSSDNSDGELLSLAERVEYAFLATIKDVIA